jgi:hypothetical protein
MATILDKDITRESTVTVDGREVQVTLTADQTISFKLKGMKSGVLSIGIDELYNQLAGVTEEVKEKPKEVPKKKKSTEELMISLYRLRSLSLVTKMDFKVKLELEKVICELINDEKFKLD